MLCKIFEVQKPDPQEFAKYFTRAGYTTLIERQRSLIKPIAQELAKTELFKLSTDPDFIADLSDRTGMTSNEVTSFYIDNVMDNIIGGMEPSILLSEINFTNFP